MSSETDVRYMNMALALAKEAGEAGEVPVGAVLIDEAGNLLAEARNSPIEENDPTAHAEILALRKAGKRVGNYRLTETTLYVTIEPCPMCAGALLHARVKRLVFGAPDPKTGACGSVFNLVQDHRMNHRLEVTSGVLENDCSRIIKEFFRKKRGK